MNDITQQQDSIPPLPPARVAAIRSGLEGFQAALHEIDTLKRLLEEERLKIKAQDIEIEHLRGQVIEARERTVEAENHRDFLITQYSRQAVILEHIRLYLDTADAPAVILPGRESPGYQSRVSEPGFHDTGRATVLRNLSNGGEADGG